MSADTVFVELADGATFMILGERRVRVNGHEFTYVRDAIRWIEVPSQYDRRFNHFVCVLGFEVALIDATLLRFAGALR